MLRNTDSPQIGPVDVYTPQLLDAIEGVVDGVKVLSESSGGDEGIDLAVLGDDMSDSFGDRLRSRDITIVTGDLRRAEMSQSGCLGPK